MDGRRPGGYRCLGDTLNITASRERQPASYLNTSEVTPRPPETDPDSTPNNGITTEDDYAEVSTTPNRRGRPVADQGRSTTRRRTSGSNVVFTLTVSQRRAQ